MNTPAGTVRRLRRPCLPYRVGIDEALRAATKLLDAGRVAEARHLFEQVRVSAPDHPTALTLLASIAFREGEERLGEAYRERAIESLRAGLENDPDAPGLLAPLVNLLLAAGRDTEAEPLAARLRLPFNPIRMDGREFHQRWQQARSRGLPPVLLVTVPKSASETVWSRLSDGLRLPRAHLSLGLFPHCLLLPARVRAFAEGGMAAKEHILPTPHNLRALAAAGVERLVVHLRDPRQCLLSWAHFVLDSVARRRLGPLWRDTVPPKRVLDAGLAAVLDWCIGQVLPHHLRFVRAWLGVATAGTGPRIRFTTFEQFLADPDGHLARLLAWFGVDPALCDRAAAGRAADVHRRRGEAEEWRRVLDRDQRRRLASLWDAELAERFGWSP